MPTVDTDTSKQTLALDLLHAAYEASLRQDRATAATIRASRRAGIEWRAIAASLHITEREALEILDRWPGEPD